MFVKEILPNDCICHEGLRGKTEKSGNRRFAILLSKVLKRYASSRSAIDQKRSVDFAVNMFMRAPNCGRFLRSLNGCVYATLTKSQAVRWVYNSLHHIPKSLPRSRTGNNIVLNSSTKVKSDMDNKVATILGNQKNILLKMQREGKIKQSVSSILLTSLNWGFFVMM